MKKAFLIIFLSANAIGLMAQEKFVLFNSKNISYEGRVGFTPDAAVLSWPGTSVYFNFKGKSVEGEFKDSDTSNYYNIIIDGNVYSKIHFDTTKNIYLLASGLKNKKHTLQLFKRTEWDKGKTYLYALGGYKVKALPPSRKPRRKMEFFGNSITCGYAIEDYTNDSHFGYYENNYDSYAAITARHFNAQYHCTSKSGIGITISWFPMIEKEMYDRLDATDSTSKWDFTKYIPDLVIVNLLQNDSWLVNMPNHEQFKYRFGTQKPSAEFIVSEYRIFIKALKNKYPNAKIICMLGNMDITREDSVWPAYVTKAVAQLNDKNIYTLFVPYKNTQGHPKTVEQKSMSDTLIRFIEKNISW